MLAKVKCGRAVAVLTFIAIGLIPRGASAVTAEIARKCEALAYKAYPPQVVGNPAAGGARGPAAREYFKLCLKNGGSMDGQPNGNDDQQRRK
jgi:hypothetical protein